MERHEEMERQKRWRDTEMERDGETQEMERQTRWRDTRDGETEEMESRRLGFMQRSRH